MLAALIFEIKHIWVDVCLLRPKWVSKWKTHSLSLAHIIHCHFLPKHRVMSHLRRLVVFVLLTTFVSHFFRCSMFVLLFSSLIWANVNEEITLKRYIFHVKTGLLLYLDNSARICSFQKHFSYFKTSWYDIWDKKYFI